MKKTLVVITATIFLSGCQIQSVRPLIHGDLTRKTAPLSIGVKINSKFKL